MSPADPERGSVPETSAGLPPPPVYIGELKFPRLADLKPVYRPIGGLAPIPVLLYHAVTDSPPPDQPAFTVSPARFAEHVAAMVASGRPPLTIDELGACLRHEQQWSGPSFAVTFDDGFPDTVAATALLAEHGISSTVFITTGRMDGDRPALPAEAVAALAANPLVELGAHTVSHPYLDELELPELTTELADSRLRLEQQVGRRSPRSPTHTVPTAARCGGRSARLDSGPRPPSRTPSRIRRTIRSPWPG